MIDAQAVSAQLETLGDLPSQAGHTGHATAAAWLEDAVAGSSLAHEQDAAGNLWVTLRGSRHHTVLLGSYLREGAGTEALDSHIGLVAGLQTMKALAQRYGVAAPSMVRLVVWKTAAGALADQSGAGAFLPFPADVAAYLELHVLPGAGTGAPLGVAAAAAEGEAGGFHPRLTALGDEAVRELTGTAEAQTMPLSPMAAQVAEAGIPTAALYVHTETRDGGPEIPRARRLHLLQAAEAYGRWAEATMHLVGGDAVDLWAREHRVPRS